MTDDVASHVVHYKEATDGDSVIRCEVVGVGAYGLFSTGWIGYNFMYEQPHVVLDVNSEIGFFQVDISLDDIDDTPLMNSLDDFNPDVQNLIGDTIFVDPNNEFSKGCISSNIDVVYDEENEHAIRLGQDNKKNVQSYNLESENHLSGTQKMPLTRFNNLLSLEKKRLMSGDFGWLEVELSVEETDSEVKFKADVDSVQGEIEWSFNNTANGYSRINDFVETLSINHTLEGKTETVWIKPVRSLHFTNRPDDTKFISDKQTWAVNDQPLKPEKPNKSLFQIIREFLIPSRSIDVSSSNTRSSKAKIHKTYSKYDDVSCYSDSANSSDQLSDRQNVELA